MYHLNVSNEVYKYPPAHFGFLAIFRQLKQFLLVMVHFVLYSVTKAVRCGSMTVR